MSDTPRTDATLAKLENSSRKLQKDIEESSNHETPIKKRTKNALFWEGLMCVAGGLAGLVVLIIAALYNKLMRNNDK